MCTSQRWAISEIMFKGLWKSQGHNVNRHNIIIYECHVWQQTPWAFRHSILPWGHNLSTFYPRQPKRFYVSFTDILEVYILISNLRQVSHSNLCLHWWRNEWKISSKHEMLIWRYFPCWKEREKSIGTQAPVYWFWVDCPHPSPVLPLPALIPQCCLVFDKD